MLLWRPSTSLLLVLVFSFSIQYSSGNSQSTHVKSVQSPTKHQNDQSVPSSSSASSSMSLTSRKMDASDKQGLLAGPMFLGLASLLFPVLPILLLAPIAMAGMGPALNFLSDTVNGVQSGQGMQHNNNNQQAINDVLNSLQQNGGISGALQALSSSNPPAGSILQGSQGSVSSSSGSAGSSIQNPQASGSSISSMVQALGFGQQNSGSSPNANAEADESSLLSGLFGSQGISGSDSIFSSIFGPDKNAAAAAGGGGGSGGGLFGSGGAGSILGNLASGSRPIPSYVRPPGKGSASGPASEPSVSPTDFLGAAAAALDNAGLLGPLSGAGSGSVTSQLLNLVGGSGGKPGSSGSSSSSSSPSISELLGLSSSIPESAGQTQARPLQSLAGSSLTSNIIQGLPASYGGGQSSSSSPFSSSTLASLLGLGGGSPSKGSFQKLANNALSSISNFIFSKKRSEWMPRPYPEFGYVDVASAASKLKGTGLTSYFRDVFSTLKDGIRRYEIGESECQARLVCELHQKAVGRSFKTWANTILDILGVENYLERTSFAARTKSVMKDLYRAARNGMVEKDCAVTYSKCPVSISVEPLRNSILNKMIGGSGHHYPQTRTSVVYGPTILPSGKPSTHAGNQVHHQTSHHQQQQSQHQSPQHQQQVSSSHHNSPSSHQTSLSSSGPQMRMQSPKVDSSASGGSLLTVKASMGVGSNQNQQQQSGVVSGIVTGSGASRPSILSQTPSPYKILGQKHSQNSVSNTPTTHQKPGSSSATSSTSSTSSSSLHNKL